MSPQIIIKKSKLIQAFLYLLYLIIVAEIILRIPFIYNRIFKSYELKAPNVRIKTREINGYNKILYLLPQPNSVWEFIYPSSSFFSSTEKRGFIKTNNYGFRGKDFDEKKPKNSVRVAFLGDSFTFGWGLFDAETYPEKVCKKLRELFPNKDIECMNLASPGNNIFNCYHIFMDIALRLTPDIVIYGFNINDVEGNIFYYDKKNNKIEPNPRILDLFEGAPMNIDYSDRFFSFSYLYRFIDLMFFLRDLKSQTIQSYYNLYSEDNLDDLQLNITSLIELKNECDRRNIKFIVLFFPILYKLNDEYPFFKIHSFMHNVFQENKITYIDLFPYFRVYKDYELWVHPKDKHPNDKANSIIAELLVEFLSKNFLEKSDNKMPNYH